MAALNTDISTQQASGRADTRVDGALFTGTKLVMRSTYTVTGAEAASDTINLGAPPPGARVTGGRIWTDGGGGTGLAVSTIGTSTTADLISATSVAVVSAGSTAITPKATTPSAALDGATSLLATLALTSGTPTAGKLIVFDIDYFV